MGSALLGLSPRLWGNHAKVKTTAEGGGSIPTPVGEPSKPLERRLLRRVYPHACGGTVLATGALTEAQGLSPRLWGNPATR